MCLMLCVYSSINNKKKSTAGVHADNVHSSSLRGLSFEIYSWNAPPSRKKQRGRSNQLSVPKNRAHQIPWLQNNNTESQPAVQSRAPGGMTRETPSYKPVFHVGGLALSFQAATSIATVENYISLLPGTSALLRLLSQFAAKCPARHSRGTVRHVPRGSIIPSLC